MYCQAPCLTVWVHLVCVFVFSLCKTFQGILTITALILPSYSVVTVLYIHMQWEIWEDERNSSLQQYMRCICLLSSAFSPYQCFNKLHKKKKKHAYMCMQACHACIYVCKHAINIGTRVIEISLNIVWEAIHVVSSYIVTGGAPWSKLLLSHHILSIM